MTDLLGALGLIFVVSAVLLVVAHQFSIPVVPVYIITGLMLPPLVGQDLTLELAQWGIAFLVFVFGVNVEPTRLEAVTGDSEFVAAESVLILGGFGYGAALLLGLDALNAIYFSIAAALSSSLVGQDLIRREIYINLLYGRLVQSVHFIQDLIAIVLILVLSASVFTPDAIAAALGYGVLLLLIAVVVRVYLFGTLIRLSGGSDELLILTAIGMLIGFIIGSELAGVSIAIGAFAAGLAITKEFTQNLALLNGLDSLESFFSAIFFVVLGSLVTVPTLDVVIVAATLIVLIAILKPIVTIYLLLYRGYETRTACLTSFSLDQVSEFSLIIAIQAFILGRIAPDIFQAIILASAVTMITSTATKQFEEELYRFISRYPIFTSAHEKMAEQSNVESDLSDHIVLIGYGKLGTQVGKVCHELEEDLVVVDHDPDQLAWARREHSNYVFGDAMDPETWQRAGIDSCRLIYSTVPDRRLSERLLEIETEADVIVRADRTDEALDLFEQGAAYVNVPDFLASERLTDTVRDLLAGERTTETLRDDGTASLRDTQVDLQEAGPWNR
ncbi:cation:proton antiporter [Halalkalicoccus tibetensis]|uniref:Cation:proton antiporter n=1 Tax=Halalkalicoccus tibetensis TaxID=175632 RepID=A0ABD5V650_9EURY